MAHLPYNATDDDIIAFVDEWVKLLIAEDYDRAFAFTAHAFSEMTVEMFRDHVRLQSSLHALGDGQDGSNQLPRLTFHGKANAPDET